MFRPQVNKNLKHYLMLLPYFFFFGLFFLWPIVYGLGMSLAKWNGVQPPVFVGIQNYIKVIHSRDFSLGMENMAHFVLLAIPLGIGTSLGLALLVSRFRGFWHNFFRAAYFLPFVIPIFLSALIWRWLLTPEYGFINVVLMKLGFQSIDWISDPKYMIYSVVVVDLWRAAGFNMVLLLAGIKSIPEDYYEAAKVDGVNPWQEAFQITIPLLEPILFVVIVNAFISTIQMFDVPWLLSRSDYNTQGGPLGGMLFPVMDIMGRAFGSIKFGEAAAYSVVLLVICLLVTVVQFLFRRWHAQR